jgi:Ca2+/Na+ antiporter
MYEALLIAVTVIAMMSPSVYTIAWSKQEHKKDLPVLYIGLGISALTVVGAFFRVNALMWFGLLLAFVFFGYVMFFYGENNDNNDYI